MARLNDEGPPEAPPLLRASGVADLTLESATRRHVRLVLEYTDCNLSWAAEELGIEASTLHRMLKRWQAGRKKGMRTEAPERRAVIALVATGG